MAPSLESVNAEIVLHLTELHKLVKAALSQSMKVFEDLDIVTAEQYMESTGRIEILHHKIEDIAFEAISNFSPKSVDLRRLVAYIHTSGGLHFVGRYAFKIMEIVTLSEGLDHFKDLVTLPYLSELAKAALSIALRAILEEDLSEIDELEKIEAQSDNEATEMFQEISMHLNNRRDISNIAMLYVIVGRYFERATDQAINIAESAIYLVKGERKKLGFAYKGVEDLSDLVIDI